MVRKLYEIVKLENILLYKGTKDKTDPITTKSFFSDFSFEDNKFKWFTEEPHVAELYGSDSIWVYLLKGPIYIIKLYDKNSQEITTTSLKILDFIINNYTEKFLDFNNKRIEKNTKDLRDMLPDKDNILSYLKLPFGLLTTDEQYVIAKPNNILPPINILDTDSNGDYYIQKHIFQRLSLHNLDKFLMVFLDKYKTELLYYYLLFKNFPHDSPLLNDLRHKKINGYSASSWNTMWHGNFHSEICLFDTSYNDVKDDTTQIIFIGRYKVKNNEREWITYDNKKIHYQIPFIEIQYNFLDIRQLCLLGNTSSAEYMDIDGGSKSKSKNSKNTKQTGTDKNIFGKLESVPYEQYIKPLSEKEKNNTLKSMYKYFKNDNLTTTSSRNKKSTKYYTIDNPDFSSFISKSSSK